MQLGVTAWYTLPVRAVNGSFFIMDVWQQVVVSAVVVLTALTAVMGFVVDFPEFKKRLPEWLRQHPQFKWIFLIPLITAVYLHVIWSRPVHQPAAKDVAEHVVEAPLENRSEEDVEAHPDEVLPETPPEQPPAVLSDDKKKQDVPELVANRQADEMAREFLDVLPKITGKSLLPHEEKFWAEYLRATMPAKIASICGDEECAQYEELLKRLRSNSDSLQLHYRGVEPFVTRKRFINPQTPPAGPVISLTQAAPSNQDTHPPENEPKVVIAAKPVIDEATQTFVPTPREEPEQPPKAVPEVSEPAIKNLTPQASRTTSLKQYLNRTGWVQCRRCGTTYTKSFEFFAEHDSMKCKSCRFQMRFVGFHQDIAAEAERLKREHR